MEIKKWASRIKPRLRIEGEGTKDKEDGGGKANEGSKKNLERLYITMIRVI